ncbi:MmgE/PrpD family protein, partial [Thioclava sp. UBA3469]
MSVMQNAFAEMPEGTTITEEAARFVESVTFEDIPEEALTIGKRCLIDALGLYVAGSEEHSVHILAQEAEYVGGREESRLLGSTLRVLAAMAARVLGTAGHAHDWDDSQVSIDPAHIYGLLT